MTSQNEIEKLKADIFSADRETAKASVRKLLEIGGQNNIDFLIALLDQPNVAVRNVVAMTFMDNRVQEALDPLLQSITKKENARTRGTMVYALQALDCSMKLRELFSILFEAAKNFEVQSGILTVLDEQEFEFTTEDLLDIQEAWNKLKDSWDELNGIDPTDRNEYDIDRNIIQDVVDGYLAYLRQTPN